MNKDSLLRKKQNHTHIQTQIQRLNGKIRFVGKSHHWAYCTQMEILLISFLLTHACSSENPQKPRGLIFLSDAKEKCFIILVKL